ncbi:hypothetical protein D3C83_06520 [compost metagenome]
MRIDPRAGQRQPFHREPRAVGTRTAGFVVLEPVKLAGAETPRGNRRMHHHFHDEGRKPDDFVHRCTEPVIEARQKLLIAHGCGGFDL